MATPLNPGFENNANVIQIRTSGSSMQRVTDRAIDVDGDGEKEQATVTSGTAVTSTPNGSKMKPPSETEGLGLPTGIARSVIERTRETDLGVTLDESVQFTEGGEATETV